jgi:hypothetical protein
MLDQLFEGQALWFTVPALLGTAMFSLRILMMLIGGVWGESRGLRPVVGLGSALRVIRAPRLTDEGGSQGTT